MRTLASVVVVLAVVGCKAKDNTADSTVSDTAAAAVAPAPAPAAPGARFAGRWSGVGYMGNDKKAQNFTVVADSSGSSIAYSGTDTVRYHPISMSDTAFVLESQPYMDRQSKMEVIERVEGRAVGDSMVGTVEMRPTKGGKPMTGRWTAHRATP
jgi:hypothetical protein